MKITFQGFRLYAGDGISLTAFMNLLVSNSSTLVEHPFNEYGRIFLLEDKSDHEFYTGLLVTVKDQRTFCELRNEAGKYSIRRSELDANAQLMDFNFFVLNKTTHCGVYQHYHASCSPMQFGIFLRHLFWNPERDLQKKRMIKKMISTGTKKDVAEKAAKKAFKKSLMIDMFYKPEDFEEILKAMKEIKGFQYNLATAKSRPDNFNPDLKLKNVQKKLLFSDSNLVGKISKSIGDFVKQEDIKHGKVRVFDQDGIERSIHLDRNIEGFGEFEFDDVTADIELDLVNFSKSKVIQNLLQTARDNPLLFGAPDA